VFPGGAGSMSSNGVAGTRIGLRVLLLHELSGCFSRATGPFNKPFSLSRDFSPIPRAV
jgi:hypothetical protein